MTSSPPVSKHNLHKQEISLSTKKTKKWPFPCWPKENSSSHRYTLFQSVHVETERQVPAERTGLQWSKKFPRNICQGKIFLTQSTAIFHLSNYADLKLVAEVFRPKRLEKFPQHENRQDVLKILTICTYCQLFIP